MEIKASEQAKMDKKQTISIKVQRGTSGKSWYEDYQIPFVEGRSILGILQYIFENIDATIAFTGSCRIGLCSSCLVRVNGKVVRACTTIPQDNILIEPYKHTCVSRDLIVTA